MNHSPEQGLVPVGFIGLGLMGSAMALNLHEHVPLVVWNRTPSASEPLRAAGASVAPSAQAVFESARVVFVMLSDETAIDTVLSSMSRDVLRDRILVLMSTVSPQFSTELAGRMTDAAGMYVEAPVSGSRQPAVDGTLVSMLAGDDDVVDRVEPLVRAMCATVFRCGTVPSALTMKLAVNTFLIALVTGLAEAFHFAEASGVDPASLGPNLRKYRCAPDWIRTSDTRFRSSILEHPQRSDLRNYMRVVRAVTPFRGTR